MHLSDARDAYEDFSRKASEIVRQLALAAVALIWVFKTGDNAHPVLDPKLLHAVVCVVLSLLLDLLQYLISFIVWLSFFRLQERKDVPLDGEVSAPSWINLPNYVLFWGKSAFLLIAYAVYILPYLHWKLK